ncbi:MAG: hypothetical protein NC409_02935 [Clostridium sp.]|nr:hypothetical protein [Clostridium sp.]
MKKIVIRRQRILFFVVCTIAVVLGGIYYYGILHAFVPHAEDLASTQHWYLILTNKCSYSHDNIIFDGIMCLSVLVGGMSYFASRLASAMTYTVILGLSLYLSLTQKRGKNRWFLLPLWAFFCVLIHTLREASDFLVYDSTDLIRPFPYNYHAMPIIWALISLIVLQCFWDTHVRKRKSIIGGIGIIVVVYALLFTDLIYYVIFAVPMLIVLLLRGLYSDKTRKYMLPLLGVGVGIMLLTRILPGDFFEKLWSDTGVESAYGTIYGATNWLSLDNIFLHITNYIKTIMLLFNIDLSNRPIISLYSVLFVVRIGFVVIGYVVVAKIILYSVKGKAQQNGYGVIDEVLAWAFVVLSCLFIFTENALYKDLMRYYTAFVPILTILLCRNIGSFLRMFLPILERIQYKKSFFAGLVAALCICQMEPVWLYKVRYSYQEDCEAAIGYLRQWGAEKDGYVVAPYWLYPRLSAMTEGEILFYPNEWTVKQLYGEDAAIKYMVVGWDDMGLLNYGLNDIAYGSYEEMCEKYKAPVRAVDLDYMYVCEFED